MGFPYPPSGKCRGNACRHAGNGVEREGGVMPLAEQGQALLAEGGEGGEPSAKPRGEEKPCLVGEAEAGGEGVEQPEPSVAHGKKRGGMRPFITACTPKRITLPMPPPKNMVINALDMLFIYGFIIYDLRFF